MRLLPLTIIFFILLTLTFQSNPYELTVCFDNTTKLSDRHIQRVVEVIPGWTVHVWCRHCNAKNDYYPRLWFYKPRGLFKTMEELQTNYDIVDILTITISHTVNINNFHPNNSGVYTCSSYGNKNENTYTYVLDGVTSVEVTPKTGPVSQWRAHKRIYFDSINEKFKISAEEPYKTLRNKYDMILSVYTTWDNWGECKQIEGHQKGIRKRLGRCRIGLVDRPINGLPNIITPYLTDGYDVPCRSIKINESYPVLSRIIRNIPEFQAKEICTISQKPENFKIKKKQIKLKSIQVMENSHVTLMCSEKHSNADMKWFKDKKLLKIYGSIGEKEDEPSISMDNNNSLHILHVTKNEEGNYTCSINGKIMKQFEVKVISKSKLLNQEFIRYSIYLGFVLSLTMTCYCAGVCVAWHRRTSFLDPLNLNKNKRHKNLKYEQEKLLG